MSATSTLLPAHHPTASRARELAERIQTLFPGPDFADDGAWGNREEAIRELWTWSSTPRPTNTQRPVAGSGKPSD